MLRSRLRVASTHAAVAGGRGSSSAATTVRCFATATRPLRAIAHDAAEQQREQEVVAALKSRYGNMFQNIDTTRYASAATTAQNAGGSESGGSGSESGSGSGGSGFGSSWIPQPPPSGGQGLNARNLPMFLTGLVLIYCGFKLIYKRQKDITEPSVMMQLASTESHAKHLLFVSVTDAAQRQALQNEFAQVRRSNPYLSFFDWLDTRMPMWGFGQQNSRQQAVEVLTRVLAEGSTQRTTALAGAVMGLEYSRTDPALRVDKLVDTANGGGSFATLFGGSAPPPPPPQYGYYAPPAQYGAGQQQQQQGPYPTQFGAGGYLPPQQQQQQGQQGQQYGGYSSPPPPPGAAPQYGYYGGHPAAASPPPPPSPPGFSLPPDASGVAVGGRGNPYGSHVQFSDVLSSTQSGSNGVGDSSNNVADGSTGNSHARSSVASESEVHGTDPFARAPQTQTQTQVQTQAGAHAGSGSERAASDGSSITTDISTQPQQQAQQPSSGEVAPTTVYDARGRGMSDGSTGEKVIGNSSGTSM